MKGPSENDRKAEARERVSDSTPSGAHHGFEVHPGPESDDRELQESGSQGSGFTGPTESDREYEAEKQGLGPAYRS